MPLTFQVATLMAGVRGLPLGARGLPSARAARSGVPRRWPPLSPWRQHPRGGRSRWPRSGLSDARASHRCSRRSLQRGMRARRRRSRCTPPGGCKACRFGELRFVLARVDAVHRADVHARSVLGIDAGVGDDERHARESPSGVREVLKVVNPCPQNYIQLAGQHNSDLSGRDLYSVDDPDRSQARPRAARPQ